VRTLKHVNVVQLKAFQCFLYSVKDVFAAQPVLVDVADVVRLRPCPPKPGLIRVIWMGNNSPNFSKRASACAAWWERKVAHTGHHDNFLTWEIEFLNGLSKHNFRHARRVYLLNFICEVHFLGLGADGTPTSDVSKV
jgi:hypothetical protein